jgi:hypothetical protein
MNRSASHRWRARGATLLLLAGAVVDSAALAQSPNGPAATDPGPATVHTNKTEFRLPIRIDERARAGLREITLYVRHLPGDWLRKDSVAPTRDHFLYRVTEEGEYWFNLVTVDKQNRTMPADIQRERPGLIVVVDTQPPALEVQALQSSGGEAFVRCTIHDRNADHASLKLTYRGTDQRTRPLESVPNNPGIYQLSSAEMQAGSISAVAKDRAGNVTTKELNVRELTQADLTPPGAHSPAVAQLPASRDTSLPPPSDAPVSTPLPPPPREPLQPPGDPKLDPFPVKAANDQSPKSPASVPPAPKRADPKPPNLPDVNDKTGNGGPKLPPPPAPSTTATQRKILGTTHAVLDYRLDQVGPSGVAKVEVWLTADQGNTWQKLCEDADRRSPVEIDLPGEGVFGVRIAVTNGNGFGGTPPAKGDTAHSWVEVDTTSPVVQMRDIEPVTNGSTIDVRWTASDKNVGADSVNLYAANRREGPWTPIARGVKNDGSYRWAFPRDAGTQFFFRVEIADQAGNVARAETTTALVLDMTEPRALVVGITGASNPAAPR